MSQGYRGVRYHVYLFRCWQETEEEEADKDAIWHFSLEDPTSGDRLEFEKAEELVAHLREIFERPFD